MPHYAVNPFCKSIGSLTLHESPQKQVVSRSALVGLADGEPRSVCEVPTKSLRGPVVFAEDSRANSNITNDLRIGLTA